MDSSRSPQTINSRLVVNRQYRKNREVVSDDVEGRRLP
jgi:hypothetical protein